MLLDQWMYFVCFFLKIIFNVNFTQYFIQLLLLDPCTIILFNLLLVLALRKIHN